MARRSQRLSETTKAPGKHKRAASGSNLSGANSKRTRKSSQASRTTPTKSQYFQDDDDEHHGVQGDAAATSSASAETSGSDFDQEPADSDQTPEPDVDESDSEPEKKRTSSKGRKAVTVFREKDADGWRPGASTGLEPGVELVFKKRKPRPAGKIPYTDHTIHPNTLLFLKELKANNKREWLKMHDPDFRQAEKDWHSFVDTMTGKLMEIDDTIPELPVKDVIFRIYRDVRFSKDPTPYKPWFSVAWSRAGRKGNYAHYYVQIAPGNSFVGGGLWHPEAAPTHAMRRAIDRHPRRLKDVLLNDRIRQEFLAGASKSDMAVVKAFTKSNAENALKTRPKDYDAGHPDIDLLRLRNYTIGRKLSDEEVLGEPGMQRIAQLLAALFPFITHLNSVVMPDDASSEEEDEEDEEESGGNEASDD